MSRDHLIFFDQSPFPSWICERKTLKIIDVNKAAIKLTGFSRLQTTRKLASDILKGMAFNKLKIFRDAVVQHKNGEESVLSVSLNRYLKGKKEYIIIAGTRMAHSVITPKDNKAPDISLHEFRHAIDNASIVSMADKTGTITYVNENFITISGYHRKELIGQNHHIINSGYHPRSFWIQMWKTISKGKTWRAEVRNKAKDGTFYWVDTFIMPLMNEHGEIREYLSIRNDITERKKAEDEIVRLNKSLSNFQSAIHGSSIVSMADKSGTITYVNDNFVRISGYSKEELIGNNHRIINAGYHPKDFWVHMWKTISRGETWRREVKNKSKNGGYYWVDTFIMPFLDDNGKVREYLSIRNDITSRKINEELLGLSHEQLKQTLHFAKLGSFTIESTSKRISLSPALLNILDIATQYPREIEIDDFIKQFVVKSHRHETKKALTSRVKEKEVSFEVLLLTATGEIKLCFFQAHLQKDYAFGVLKDITDIRAKEHQQKQQSLMIENMLAGISDGFYAMDKSWRLTLVNPLFARLAGQSPEDLIGKNIWEAFPESMTKKVYHQYNEAVDSGKPQHFEIEISSGGVVEVHAYPNPEGLFVYFRDISQRKEVEKNLKIKNEQIENILSSIQDYFIAIDRNHCITMINDSFADLIDEDKDSLIGKNIWEKFPVILGTEIERDFFTVMERGQKLSLDYPSRRSPGRYFHINFYPNESGIVALFEDVTERKQIENEFRRLALVAEHTSNGVLFTDPAGMITWANHGYLKITEYSLDEVLGKSPFDFLAGPETSEEAINQLKACITKKSRCQVELLSYSKSGRPYWVDVEMIPVYSESGEHAGFMSVESEITRLKVAVHEMLKSQEQLQTIMDYSPADVFVKDLNGRYLFYNKSFQQNFVQKRYASAITEHTLFDKTKADEFAQVDKEIIEKGLPITLEQNVVIAGKQECFLTVKFPMRNTDGDIYSVGGVALKITERKQMEKALREGEVRLKTISDNLPEGAIYQLAYDPSLERFRYLYFSSGVESITGIAAKDIVHDHDVFYALLLEEDRQVYLERKSVSLQSLGEFDFEFRIRKRTGELRWLRSRSQPRTAENGTVVWDGFLIDLTDRKRVEEKLRQSETRLNTIFQNMINGVLVVDTLGEITFANDRAVQILDLIYSKEEHRYYSAREWKAVDEQLHDYPLERLPLAVALNQQKQVANEEYGIIAPGEKLKWLMVSASPMYGVDGEMIGAMASFLEITERKEAEEELMRASSRLLLATHSAGIGIWDWNMETSEVIWDEKLYEIFGVAERDKRSLEKWKECIHPEDREKTVKSLESAAKNNEVFDVEYRIVHPSTGVVRHIHDYGAMQRSNSWEPTHMVGVCWDITSQKLNQQSLFNSESELRASVKEKEILIKEIHHRVKNNLQLISSIIYLKIISLEQSDIKTFLENLRQKIKSIALIHERLLQSEKLNQVEISDYLGKLILDIKISHQNQEQLVQITSDIVTSVMPLDTAIYCGLIVNELVTNSIKHAFKGRTEGTIDIQLRKDSDRYQLRIKDDGITLPADVEPGKGNSFGMQMLDVFIRQISASAVINRNEGTEFIIEFC